MQKLSTCNERAEMDCDGLVKFVYALVWLFGLALKGRGISRISTGLHVHTPFCLIFILHVRKTTYPLTFLPIQNEEQQRDKNNTWRGTSERSSSCLRCSAVCRWLICGSSSLPLPDRFHIKIQRFDTAGVDKISPPSNACSGLRDIASSLSCSVAKVTQYE